MILPQPMTLLLLIIDICMMLPKTFIVLSHHFHAIVQWQFFNTVTILLLKFGFDLSLSFVCYFLFAILYLSYGAIYKKQSLCFLLSDLILLDHFAITLPIKNIFWKNWIWEKWNFQWRWRDKGRSYAFNPSGMGYQTNAVLGPNPLRKQLMHLILLN